MKVKEVHFTPEQEAQLSQIASKAGTDPERLVKDAALSRKIFGIEPHGAARIDIDFDINVLRVPLQLNPALDSRRYLGRRSVCLQQIRHEPRISVNCLQPNRLRSIGIPAGRK